MRPEAKFSDGTQVTADDVVFSFNALKEKGHPQITQIIREFVTAEAIDERNVRLTLSGKQSRDLIFTLTALPVFSKAYYSDHDFEASTLQPPLCSGAHGEFSCSVRSPSPASQKSGSAETLSWMPS